MRTRVTANGPPDASTSRLDDLFAALSRRRRRIALAYLRRRSEPVVLGDVVTAVQSLENSGWGGESADSTSQVYASLYHVHLPALVRCHLIAYDEETDLVEYMATGERDELVASLLEVADRADCSRDDRHTRSQC